MSIKSAFATGLSSLVLTSYLHANSPINKEMEAVHLLIQGALVGGEKRNILVETDSNDIKNIKTSACKERPVYDLDTFKQIRTMKVYISEGLLQNQFEGTEYIKVDNRNTTIIIESPNCKK